VERPCGDGKRSDGQDLKQDRGEPVGGCFGSYPVQNRKHQQPEQKGKYGVLPGGIQNLTGHGEIEGNFRDQCEECNPQHITAKVPGVKIALGQKKAEDGKGKSSDDIIQNKIQRGRQFSLKDLREVVEKHTDTCDDFQFVSIQRYFF